MWASGEDKGFTLQHTSVELFNFTALNDTDSILGFNILLSIYIINFFLTLFLVAISLQPMFLMFKNIFIDDKEAPHRKFLLAAGSVLAFLYFIATVTVEFDELQHVVFVHQNMFGILKITFLTIVLLYFLLLLVCTFCTFTQCSHVLGAFFVVGSISAFAAIILLSFTPTIILLFVHPVDTSSLLALHVALFYTSTIVMAIIFQQIYSWITKDTKKNVNDNSSCCNNSCCEITPSPSIQSCVMVIFYTGFYILLLPLSYIYFILLYQIIIIRSEYSDVALTLSDFARYIPSIIIGGFGFWLNNGTFLLLQTKDEDEDEDEDVEKQKAKKWWTTLGEYLQPRDPVQNNDDDNDARKHAVAIWIDLGKRLMDELAVNDDNAHKYLSSRGINQLLDSGGGDRKAHSDRLEKVLRKNKLKLIPVKGDGNCCFGAVAEALRQLPSHINLSQLLGCEVHSQMDLRKLAVKEWTDHTGIYQPFLVNKDIKEEAQKFTKSGFYDSDLGDSMVLALSNALQLPILVFMSIPGYPVMKVLPRSSLGTNSLKIAYNQFPPSHYDCAASTTARC